MILKAPTQSKFVLGLIKSGKTTRVAEEFSDYESQFIGFPPFLRVKKGHESSIKFQTGNWPNKKEISEHCEPVSWTEFLKISGMRDYKSIERALSFYHRALTTGEKTEYKKMLAVLEGTEPRFIPPQVDNYPEIILNGVLKFLSQEYSGVFVHGEFDPTDKPTPIKALLDSSEGLPRLDVLATGEKSFEEREFFYRRAVALERESGTFVWGSQE